MNSSIFRQYDIRGEAGVDLDEDTVVRIARAFGKYVHMKGRSRLVVGRDNRSSSSWMRDLAVEVLLASGLDVIDIGEVITPVFYFACRHCGVDAGLMITASHNPGGDNGFKLLLGSSTLYGDEIQAIAAMALGSEGLNSESGGRLELTGVNGEYIDAVKECLIQRRAVAEIPGDRRDKVTLGPRPLKVVVDCGNGTAGYIAPRLFRELGCEVVELYCESDPSFPNHHPDPVKVENCQDLIKVVQVEQADLGLGFDGDGDRLGVVDPAENIIWGDILMILFWREILPHYPGADCIVEVKCSQALVDEIVRLGGKPLIYKTGHSLIKARMKELGAVFTGEMSGHMFFADEYYGYDDALYAAGRLLRILSNSEQDLTGMLADVPRYYSTPEIRIKSSDEEKFGVVDQVLKHFRSRYEIIDVDGARILFPGGWGLVRASNTGPELIVRCEGNSPEALEAIKAELFPIVGVK